MNIPDGYTEIQAGRLAAVVTYLEMTERPRELGPEGATSIRRVMKPGLAWYRDLFRAIGEPWLWFSRLRLSDQDLASILHHPQVETYHLEHSDGEGLLELDWRCGHEAEITFLGVTPGLTGKGAGSALMRFALDRVWREPVQRLWLHTCTLDHPGALGFYRRWGFRAYKRAIEVTIDPRVTGEMPRSAAPQIPIIE